LDGDWAEHRDGAGDGANGDGDAVGLKPTDTDIFVMALAVLSIVTVGAAFLWAFRAASINPMACLRNE
jgi:hypothetical protein